MAGNGDTTVNQYYYANGEIYKGEFKNNYPNGHGEYLFYEQSFHQL